MVTPLANPFVGLVEPDDRRKLSLPVQLPEVSVCYIDVVWVLQVRLFVLDQPLVHLVVDFLVVLAEMAEVLSSQQ